MRESFCEIPIAGVQGGYYGGPQVQRRNKSRGKTNFNSRHNKINLQAHETSRQNKTNSRQNNINSRQNKMNSRQNKISSRQNTINSPQNKSKLTAKYTLTHGKINKTAFSQGFFGRGGRRLGRFLCRNHPTKSDVTSG